MYQNKQLLIPFSLNLLKHLYMTDKTYKCLNFSLSVHVLIEIGYVLINVPFFPGSFRRRFLHFLASLSHVPAHYKLPRIAWQWEIAGDPPLVTKGLTVHEVSTKTARILRCNLAKDSLLKFHFFHQTVRGITYWSC